MIQMKKKKIKKQNYDKQVELLEDMKTSFKHKFAKKPEVIDGNMKALELALKEVTKIQ